MFRPICPNVVFWLLCPMAFGQSDALLVERVEGAAGDAALERIVTELPASRELVAALRKRADALLEGRDYAKSLRLNQAAAALALRANDPGQAAAAYRDLGLCYHRTGREEDSLRANEQGLKYGLATGNKLVSAELYKGIGLAQRALGNPAAAIDAYQRSIALCEEAQNRECAVRSIGNLSIVYSQTGDFRRAVEILSRGLADAAKLGGGIEIGLLNNLAIAYAWQGDTLTSRVYFERELALARAQNDKADTVLALSNLSLNYRHDKDDLARQFAEDALRLAEEAGQIIFPGAALGTLAGIERQEGRHRQALEYLSAALKGYQALGRRDYAALISAEIGAVHADMGHDAEALEWAGKAQAEARATGFARALWQGLEVAGRAYRHAGRRDEARAAMQEQISLNETVRARLAGGEMAALLFMDAKTAPYYALTEMEVEDKRFEAALQTLEGAKGRLLVDVLVNGRADLDKRMTEDERRQERSLITAAEKLLPAALRGDAAARARWDAANRDLSLFRTTLYSAHPELKLRRAYFAPFGLADAAALIPDSRTALVEFAVTGDRIFAFVITRTNTGQLSLNVTSREWKTADAKAQVEAFRKSLAERNLSYRDQARALYRRIFEPIAGLLRDKALVGIVPDGPLWGAPLQALIQPDGRHFLEDHAVFYAPSLRALAELRQRSRHAGDKQATLLAFGAPAAGKFAGALAPLPESGREASRIGALYGKNAAAVYIGAAARKSAWMAEATRRRILHLATHGVLNTNNPLYSYMVLSDGVIEAREILDLDLSAQLVVLSACETGLGNVSSGEGLVGMSWAFLVAGSSAAVVSQWKVDSTSTSELMLAFHRSYHDAGLSPARALRRAALETLKTSAFRHPFYWAGFVVMGAGY